MALLGGGFLEFLENIKTSDRVKIDLVKIDGKTLIRKEINSIIDSYSILENLSHPFLPKIYDVKFENARTIILEEYLDGVTLDKIKLSKKQSTLCVEQLLEVLEFLHKNGVLHRDIKPSNIMLCDDIKLIDFDASRTIKDTQNKDTVLIVTRGYAPPEQYGFSESNQRTDIFALGQTIKEITTHKTWLKIADKCTNLDPKKRFSSIYAIKSYFRLYSLTKRFLLPVFSFFLAISLFTVTFIVYGSLRHDIDGIYSLFGYNTPEIFSTISNITLNSYDTGTLTPVSENDNSLSQRIQVVNKNSEFLPIFSNFKDDFDNYVFGAFSYIIDVNTGQIVPTKFQGIYLVSDTDYVLVEPSESYIYKDAILYFRNLDIMK